MIEELRVPADERHSYLTTCNISSGRIRMGTEKAYMWAWLLPVCKGMNYVRVL